MTGVKNGAWAQRHAVLSINHPGLNCPSVFRDANEVEEQRTEAALTAGTGRRSLHVEQARCHGLAPVTAAESSRKIRLGIRGIRNALGRDCEGTDKSCL